jgi:hypothetical protein
MAAAIYRQQKVLSHFPVCCWIDWLLMIKNCLIESGPPCIVRSTFKFIYIFYRRTSNGVKMGARRSIVYSVHRRTVCLGHFFELTWDQTIIHQELVHLSHVGLVQDLLSTQHPGQSCESKKFTGGNVDGRGTMLQAGMSQILFSIK